MSGTSVFPLPSFGSIAQTVGNAQLIDNSGDSWSGGEWWQQLQPGSWRGVGFILDAGQTVAGRRIAMHEYPYRDEVWAEDLGKLPRRFAVQAYLTGDDVYQQRDAMLAACEQSGTGTLVHPTLGSVQAVMLEFSITDRRERGRYVELQLLFVLAGDVQYPATTIATGQAIFDAAGALNLASQGDLSTALGSLAAVPRTAIDAVSQFTGQASSAVNDASRVVGAVKGLQGFYGRFATGSLQSLQPATATVSSLLADATTARPAVTQASDFVNQVASFL